MATFILVHGAFHGGWCWERITPLLEEAGHRVLAPNLPGTSGDPTPLGEDPLAQWAEFVARLASRSESPAILVGHSRGGIVISEAAERAPEAVARLVYVAALLVEAGQSLMDVVSRHRATRPAPAIRPAADPTRLMIGPEAAIATFYNMVGEAEAWRAAARLTPEPAAPLMTPVRTTQGRFGRIPRTYIEARHDRMVSLELQREMQAALPCDPVVTLDCDHSPFYSAVPRLAEVLLASAAALRH